MSTSDEEDDNYVDDEAWRISGVWEVGDPGSALPVPNYQFCTEPAPKLIEQRELIARMRSLSGMNLQRSGQQPGAPDRVLEPESPGLLIGLVNTYREPGRLPRVVHTT